MRHGSNVNKYMVKNIFLSIIVILCYLDLSAQRRQKIVIAQQSPVKIDGDLSDWTNLLDVSDQGFWSYEIAQDDTALYIAIHILDLSLQNMAVRNGIVFKLDSQQKGKSRIQFVYPYLDAEVKRTLANKKDSLGRDDKNELIRRSRGYAVRGFSDMPDGILSLQNAYGLHAAMIAEDDGLQYEAVVPKSILRHRGVPVLIGLGVETIDQSGSMRSNAQKDAASSTKRKVSSKQKNSRTMAVLLETQIN